VSDAHQNWSLTYNNINPFDCAVNRFFNEITNNTDIVKNVKCSQDQFSFKLPSELIPNRQSYC